MPVLSVRPIHVAFLVAGAFFMENLDGTVIATALPEMAKTFATSPVALNVGITAYLLTLAIFIPLSGWVADRFGAREVFAAAVAVFVAASMLCGFSTGIGSFTAARILQGLGGAMMTPVGRLVVLRSTEKRDLVRAIAYLTWPGLVAPLLGPPVGGFITQTLSWRWIFFLNVPLGVVAFVLAFLMIPNTRQDARQPFDIVGFLLTGIACAGLVYGMDLAGATDTSWLLVGSLVGGALLSGALAIWHMLRTKHPLFDLSIMTIPTFSVTVYAGSLFRMAINTLPFLLPLLFQVGFGLDPFGSGLLVFCLFAANLGMKAGTTWVLAHFGFRRVLVVNGIVSALTLAACALLDRDTPILLVVVVLTLGGLARSMQFTALNTIGFADMPSSMTAAASAITSMLFQLNGGFGIAIGALAVRGVAVFHGHATATITDFHAAFLIVAVLAGVAVLQCLRLPADAGAEVSGHSRPAAKAE